MHIEHIIFFLYYINELHLVGYALREIWLKGVVPLGVVRKRAILWWRISVELHLSWRDDTTLSSCTYHGGDGLECAQIGDDEGGGGLVVFHCWSKSPPLCDVYIYVCVESGESSTQFENHFNFIAWRSMQSENDLRFAAPLWALFVFIWEGRTNASVAASIFSGTFVGTDDSINLGNGLHAIELWFFVTGLVSSRSRRPQSPRMEKTNMLGRVVSPLVCTLVE
jgi:hypothetical protein